MLLLLMESVFIKYLFCVWQCVKSWGNKDSACKVQEELLTSEGGSKWASSSQGHSGIQKSSI